MKTIHQFSTKSGKGKYCLIFPIHKQGELWIKYPSDNPSELSMKFCPNSIRLGLSFNFSSISADN